MMRLTKTMACVIVLWPMLSVGAWAGDGQIDIAEIPYTISSSGSYIVVHDLATAQIDTNGITIEADNVTLDLNGHAIIGPGKAAGTSGHGIYVSSLRYNIAIRNGTARDWRLNGVSGGTANNSQFEALRCYGNGYSGIYSGAGSTVSNNSCFDNTYSGIYAASYSTISGNTCYSNTGNGIFASSGITVSGNTCSYNGDDGIYASYGCTVSGNTCSINTGDGIQVSGDCRVVDNTCDMNGYGGWDGAGILATGSENSIRNNHCTRNDRGLDLDGANNIVSGNTLIGNTTPVDAVADNQLDILISELPYTISQPGMYRLTGDLTLATQDTDGITIDTDDVTLDLNGHSLTGPGKAAGTTGNGIAVQSPTKYNIAIRNGTLRDWRQNGVGALNALNNQFEGLRCYNNGAYGILAGAGCTVSGNTCYSNTEGIYAGNGSTITGNSCYGNGYNGISAGYGNTVSGNTCHSNADDGMYAGSGSTVSGNTCRRNTGDGIQVFADCRVVDNTCNGNGYTTGDGAGIHATGSDNRITDNHCTDNDRGLDLDGANNIVSGNTLLGNTTPLDAVADNQLDILISELPYTISQPGMYRLTGNLTLATQDTNGITIDADNVTLDLNGHALIGPGKAAGTSGHGIYVNGAQYNIAIRNGTARDWRLDGVGAGSAHNSQFEALRCYNNGDEGIDTGIACNISGNSCRDNGGNGIYAGPGSTVSGNTCYNNGNYGILGAYGSTVTGNSCRDNGDNGIQAGNGVTVSGNTCYSNDVDGIFTGSGSTVTGNTCQNNTGDGIQSSNSLVAENCCMNNGTNFNLTTCTSVNNHP